MAAVGGTEVHLVTVGDQLARLGHEAVIYSPEVGAYAEYARNRGLEVVSELRRLPADCDVVISQDTIVAYDLAARYPSAVNVFRVCGGEFDFQKPPLLDGIADLIVVLSDRHARHTRGCAVNAPILRLRIPVDVDRLGPIGSIRTRPKRAVMLGNYPDRHQIVRETWGRLGVEVTAIGGTQQRFDVATAVADADIVVAKNRAALDAMACGRAVYVCDTFGGDGWVRPDGYTAMEADHFAGQATDRVIGPAELERDLDGYEQQMGMANRDLVLQHHTARDHVTDLLSALESIAPVDRPPAPLKEIARLTALQWAWEREAREYRSALAAHQERVIRAEAELAEARDRYERAEVSARAELRLLGDQAERAVAEADHLRVALGELNADRAAVVAQLERMRRTRAWRLATRYWNAKRRVGTGGR